VPLYEAKLLAGSLLPLAMGLAFFARARYRARRAGAGLLGLAVEEGGASEAQ
jgi:hypothetical protein